MNENEVPKSASQKFFELMNYKNNPLSGQLEQNSIKFPTKAEVSKQVLNALQKAAKTTGVAASRAATAIMESGIRDKLDHEVAQHYLDDVKYGLEGSDGSCLSNYKRHTLNNHEILALCCASKKNPYNRLRHVLVLINKLALAFLLSTMAGAYIPKSVLNESETIAGNTFGIGLAISLVISAYGYILKKFAVCYFCTKYNVCVLPMESCGVCVLFLLTIPSALLIAAGIIILVRHSVDRSFIRSFIVSVVLDYLSYFYYGIWNWYLISWSGCLFCPRFPARLFCCSDKTYPEGLPPQCCSLLSIFPCIAMLNMVHMGESTYLEDKSKFEEEYPGRVAIDVPMTENLPV